MFRKIQKTVYPDLFNRMHRTELEIGEIARRSTAFKGGGYAHIRSLLEHAFTYSHRLPYNPRIPSILWNFHFVLFTRKIAKHTKKTHVQAYTCERRSCSSYFHVRRQCRNSAWTNCSPACSAAICIYNG